MSGDPRDGEFRVPVDAAPDRLDRALRAFRPALSWRELRDLIARGKVQVDGARVTDPGADVVGGARLTIAVAAGRVDRSAAPPVPPFPRDRIVHRDGHIAVVDKPPGLDTVPWGDATDALDARLRATLGGAVHVVQRLDRDTSGLLVLARTAEAAGRLAHQLRRREVHRRYLALVHGQPRDGTIRSFLADDRGDGLRGSTPNPRAGKEAITHVTVLEMLRGAALVACRLESGRTHQIRIHLAEAGHMLLGERAYLREHRGPVLPAPRILLHAAELGFVHPASGVPLRFERPLPEDMAAALAALRDPAAG